MKSTKAFVLALIMCLCAGVGSAQVADVTLDVSSNTIGIGETATLTAYAQVKPGSNTAGNGIFGWSVYLTLDGEKTAISLDTGSFAFGPWDQSSGTSSSGVLTADGLGAIYDSSFFDDSLGLGAPVKLFSIDVVGESLGVVDVSIVPDTVNYNPGESVTTHIGDMGGDYSGASEQITVTPEPATMGLLGCGAVALLRRRR